MRRDKQLSIIKTDSLIFTFGASLLRRVGLKGSQRSAARMRILARLPCEIRKTLSNQVCLSNIIDGTYFIAVLEAVESVAQLHFDSSGQRVFGKPTLALEVGQMLNKCASLKQGIASQKQGGASLQQHLQHKSCILIR